MTSKPDKKAGSSRRSRILAFIGVTVALASIARVAIKKTLDQDAVDASLMAMGQTLAAAQEPASPSGTDAAPTGAPAAMQLNGQRLFVEASASSLPLETVLDTFASNCAKGAPDSDGRMEPKTVLEKDRGFVVCVDPLASAKLLLAQVKRVADPAALAASVTAIRYVYAQRLAPGQTRVVTFAAPQFDFSALGRPPASLLVAAGLPAPPGDAVFVAAPEGEPHGLEVRGRIATDPERTAESYRMLLEADGWKTAARPRRDGQDDGDDSTPDAKTAPRRRSTFVALRDGLMALASAYAGRDGQTRMAIALSGGGGPQVNEHTALEEQVR